MKYENWYIIKFKELKKLKVLNELKKLKLS